MPAVSVDIVLFSDDGSRILLIRRKAPPYQGMWAIPGGFVEPDETVEQAAVRELAEETGIRGVDLSLVYVFSEPDRDPRGRTISVAFSGTAPEGTSATAGDDAAAVQWFALDDLPDLAFDHAQIIARAESRNAET